MLATTDPDTREAREAWSSLCEHYWYPVYAFVRRHGHSDADARDLTQAFFAHTLEKNAFAHARRDRGRFRTFLLTLVRNFIVNERERETAGKRGGGQRHVSIESERETGTFSVDVPDTLTPDQTYEQLWARTTLDDAMARLTRAHADDRRFGRLKALLTDEAPASYAALSRDLDMTEGALRVAVHRLRQEYGRCLREAIAETVADPAEVDEELRYLLEVVSRR